MHYLRLRKATCDGDPSVTNWWPLRPWQLLLLLPLVFIGLAEALAQPTPADFEKFKARIDDAVRVLGNHPQLKGIPPIAVSNSRNSYPAICCSCSCTNWPM